MTPKLSSRNRKRTHDLISRFNLIGATPLKITTPQRPVKRGKQIKYPEAPRDAVSDFVQDCTNELLNLIEVIVPKIFDAKLLMEFMSLMRQLADGTMDLNDIPFLLLLEKAKILSLKTTSSMTFSTETMKFWKVVYRLLNGKAIRFLSGPKNQGDVISGSVAPGFYHPKCSQINFAVPDVTAIRKFSSDFNIPSEILPGIIHEALKLPRLNPGSPYVLSVDAKKIAMGLQSGKGDIDLWGHEGADTVHVQKAKLQKQLTICSEINELLAGNQCLVSQLPPNALGSLGEKCVALITAVSEWIRDTRMLYVKQHFALEKFTKAAANSPESELKYKHAISSTQCTMFRAQSFINEALDVNKQLGAVCSELNSSPHFIEDRIVASSQLLNMIHLKKPEDVPAELLSTDVMKQRTDLWMQVRHLTPVTGSTLHDACAISSLNKQADHIAIHIKKEKEKTFTPEQQEWMAAGTDNEKHASATLSARFMPTFMPGMMLYEEGIRIMSNSRGILLLGVSPDGSIRSDVPDRITAPAEVAVEIKCPRPAPYKTAVQYTIPTYYIGQILAEMAACNVKKLIFVSYCEQSTAFSMVNFDKVLWDKMFDELDGTYGRDVITKSTRLSIRVKEIREDLKAFNDKNVRLLAEMPSVQVVEDDLTDVHGTPYMEARGVRVRTQSTSIATLTDLVTRCENKLKEAHQLHRKKASEILAFILSDIDRIWKPEIPHHLPIAYALKGHSITNDILRKMLADVLAATEASGIDIGCLSTDGQFHPIISRGMNNKPLTLLQLQRDVWAKCSAISKQEILKLVVHAIKSGEAYWLQKIAIPSGLWKNTSKISENESSAVEQTLHPESRSKSKRRLRNAKSLWDLSLCVLRKVPKCVLNVIWACYTWPQEKQSWEDSATIAAENFVANFDSGPWYGHIERYNGKLLPALVDPSHLLTNMRVKATSTGILNVSPAAFRRVAMDHPEIASRALIVDQLDKQSVDCAKRVFSEQMENEMIKNTDMAEAKFVRLIRQWYEAIDKPGMDVQERVTKMLNMRKWLLQDINFGQFPPLGSHVKGASAIWFDSMVHGIDVRLQMYAIVGTYNHRALGTLAVESFFSDLTDLDQNKLGCPKATHIPRMMATTTEINHYRHDPSTRLALNCIRKISPTGNIYTSIICICIHVHVKEIPVYILCTCNGYGSIHFIL